MTVVELLRDLGQRLVVERMAGVDQERDRGRPVVSGVQHAADGVEVQTEHVVVVGLRLLDRLDRASGDLGRGPPERLVAIAVRVKRVDQDERHVGGRGEPAHLLDVLLVALLVEDQQRRVLGERPRGEHAAHRGRLARAGRAAGEDVLARRRAAAAGCRGRRCSSARTGRRSATAAYGRARPESAGRPARPPGAPAAAARPSGELARRSAAPRRLRGPRAEAAGRRATRRRRTRSEAPAPSPASTRASPAQHRALRR